MQGVHTGSPSPTPQPRSLFQFLERAVLHLATGPLQMLVPLQERCPLLWLLQIRASGTSQAPLSRSGFLRVVTAQLSPPGTRVLGSYLGVCQRRDAGGSADSDGYQLPAPAFN